METDFEILIVEDDPAIAESLTDGIGREGYRVHWESTGAGGSSTHASTARVWSSWMCACPMAPASMSAGRCASWGLGNRS